VTDWNGEVRGSPQSGSESRVWFRPGTKCGPSATRSVVNISKSKTFIAPVAAAALALSLAACGSDSDESSSTEAAEVTTAPESAEVTITEAWVREPATGQTRSAAYGEITNGGSTEITLVGASAPIEGTVEIHETIMGDDGAMSMQERTEGFAIAPGDTFVLQPGGPHVMFMEIDPSEITGTIPVTFIFDSGLEITADAEVQTLDEPMEEMNMGDEEMEMEEGDHEMEDGEMEMDDMGS